jgi:hypothetical protein
MSAFFVDPATVDAAVTAIIRAGVLMSLEEATNIGRGLWTLNAEAVHHRYGERAEEMVGSVEELAAYRWTPRNEPLPVLFKSLQCLLYQCDEGNVPEAELYQHTHALFDRLRATGIEKTPEYEAAPWGLCG